jgi:Leucine-rich repeat (LRR) protein
MGKYVVFSKVRELLVTDKKKLRIAGDAKDDVELYFDNAVKEAAERLIKHLPKKSKGGSKGSLLRITIQKEDLAGLSTKRTSKISKGKITITEKIKSEQENYQRKENNVFYKNGLLCANYSGVAVPIKEILVLRKFEFSIGREIPFFKESGNIYSLEGKLNHKTFGFTLENGHINKLGLPTKKLKSIPDSISDLNYLEILNLRNNAITELPESIGKLQKLYSIDLQNTKIKTIPKLLSSLPKLSSIVLLKNENLESIPLEFKEKPNIFALEKRNRYMLDFPEIEQNTNEEKQNNYGDREEYENLESIPVEVKRKRVNFELENSKSDLDDFPETKQNSKQNSSEENSEEKQSYHGDLLYRKECEALLEIERILNKKIPRYDPTEDDPDFKWNTIYQESYIIYENYSFGYSSNEGHVYHLILDSLSKIPESVGNLRSLVFLVIEKSNIYSFPENLSNLQNLEFLSLCDSSFDNIPPAFFPLKNLQYFWFSGTSYIDKLERHSSEIYDEEIDFLQRIPDIGVASEILDNWNEIRTCLDCNEELEEDLTKCIECGQYFCSKCLKYCECCDEYLCSSCADKRNLKLCDRCKAEDVCDKCGRECTQCGDVYCEMCNDGRYRLKMTDLGFVCPSCYQDLDI